MSSTTIEEAILLAYIPLYVLLMESITYIPMPYYDDVVDSAVIELTDTPYPPYPPLTSTSIESITCTPYPSDVVESTDIELTDIPVSLAVMEPVIFTPH